jgi:hypothetical protein
MKKSYIIIAALLIFVVIFSSLIYIFIFHPEEKGVCTQCKMLNCHDHATSNYCCDMCDMGNGSKCDCSMPMGMNYSNTSSEMNNSNNTSEMGA